MKSHSRIVLFLLLITALVLAGCGSSAAPTEEAEAELELLPFKMVQNPFLSNAPLFIATAEGYFEEAGLAVEFVPFERSSEAIPAVIQGQVDAFAPGSGASLFNAMAQGGGLTMVADKGGFGENDCYADLIASPVFMDAGGFEAVDTMEGLTYLGSGGGLTQYGLERWFMDTYGLDMSVMNFERVPDEVTGEALASGTGTITYAAEPERTRLLNAGQGVEIALASDFLPNTQWATIVYGPSVTEENPELGRRFMVAYLRAVLQYNEGKTDRNVEILAEATGLETEEIESLCWPTIDNSLQINPVPLQGYVEWAVENEFIDSVFQISDHIDMSYVEYAQSVVTADN